ncbi:hypothetical protein [Okeania sp. SIO2F5]|uniref:hypothetical protein n=1 Tax=Okeania sp. SIO2F5 TaxID=2607794 RepID=UPI0013BE08AB|nr:hypothetical protein [Okeania sp. SIO2F5]NEP97095.1 hypothetical protein [Okeania sp. SIO2F5]
MKRVYDINLNYLGVNPPLTPPNPPLTPPRRGGEDRVRRKERIRKSSKGRKFFVRALIRTRYHTSFHQRQN